jgi:large conductance mechanosensitive channel
MGLRGFREFIMRGNLVELAVAFVIGTAFAALIKAFVSDIITPIIAAIFGKPDFSTLTFTINSSTFRYGDFINAAITFVSIAVVIYYFVVVPYNALQERRKTEAPEDPSEKKCPYCYSDIPAAATRCPSCTSQLAAGAAPAPAPAGE